MSEKGYRLRILEKHLYWIGAHRLVLKKEIENMTSDLIGRKVISFNPQMARPGDDNAEADVT